MIPRVARCVSASLPRARFLGVSAVYRKDLFSFDLDVEKHVAGAKTEKKYVGDMVERDIIAEEATIGRDLQRVGKVENAANSDAADSSLHSFSAESKGQPEVFNSNSEAEFSHPQGNTASSDKDLLDDIFADLVFDNQSGANELDKLFSDVSSSNSMTIDLDKTTEDLFDRDTAKRGRSSVLEEQKLFQTIFETYSQSGSAADRSDKLEEQVLYNLQESFNTARSAPLKTPKHDKISQPAMKKIHANVRAALEPTLDLLDASASKSELLAFLNHTVSRYHAMDRDNDNFYVYKAKSERMPAYEARCERMCQNIGQQGAENAREPVLNAFTMPILFNHVLRVLSVKLYDGQLALTLFHTLKKNIDLYTVVCNQQTYNEIMKIYWVYMGKASLCEVELVFLEMQNNGFLGDLATFSILKEILATYHSMRMGKTVYNPGGVPIWCQEDERRAKNLGNKLRALGHSLRKQRFA